MCRVICGSCLIVCLLLGALAGCAPENPGNWSSEKVAAHLAEQLEASDVALEPTPNGFTGSAQREDGETLTIQVVLDPDASEFRWDVKGDRGFVEEGSYGFVANN